MSLKTHSECMEETIAPFRAVGRRIAASDMPVLEVANPRQFQATLDAMFDAAAEGVDHLFLEGMIMHSKKLNAFYQQIVRLVGQSGANSTMGENWQRLCHRKTGRRVYELSEGLADCFKYTELRGVSSDDLRLPYSNIYIAVPPQAGADFFYDGSKKCGLVGMYITESPRSLNMDGSERNGRSWRLCAIGEPDGYLSDGLPNWLTFTFDLLLTPGKKVTECLDDRQEFLDQQMPEELRYIYRAQDGLAPKWQQLFMLAMNVVLYATHHPEADVFEEASNKQWRQMKARLDKLPPGQKKDRLREELKGVDPRRRIYLGRGVKRMSEGTGESRPLHVRTLVQGHWRNQTHGPKHSLRKLMWINPFWRGPMEVEESNPIRVVG